MAWSRPSIRRHLKLPCGADAHACTTEAQREVIGHACSVAAAEGATAFPVRETRQAAAMLSNQVATNLPCCTMFRTRFGPAHTPSTICARCTQDAGAAGPPSRGAHTAEEAVSGHMSMLDANPHAHCEPMPAGPIVGHAPECCAMFDSGV